jgi:CheY-like chemotaxis protein
MTTKKWILLAEDNQSDVDLALRALAVPDEALEVVVVIDGLKALDCLYRRGEYEMRDPDPPSLIILDIKMPKVDGLEVLRQIKEDAQMRIIPVVIFTSSREEADLVACYRHGANAYLVKPVGFTAYRDLLQQVRKFWVVLNELPAIHPSETRPPRARSWATAA